MQIYLGLTDLKKAGSKNASHATDVKHRSPKGLQALVSEQTGPTPLPLETLLCVASKKHLDKESSGRLAGKLPRCWA